MYIYIHVNIFSNEFICIYIYIYIYVYIYVCIYIYVCVCCLQNIWLDMELKVKSFHEHCMTNSQFFLTLFNFSFFGRLG